MLQNQKRWMAMPVLLLVLLSSAYWWYPQDEVPPVMGEGGAVGSAEGLAPQAALLNTGIAPGDLAVAEVVTPQAQQAMGGDTDELEAKQQLLFDVIWEQLHDPSLRDSLSARELIATPGFKDLPDHLMQRLVDEAMLLLRNGDLPQSFMAPAGNTGSEATNMVISEGVLETLAQNTAGLKVAETVTREQRQTFDAIVQGMADPSYRESLTARGMLASPKIQALPASLRQELTGQIMAMVGRGELDAKRFFAADPSAEKPEVEISLNTVSLEEVQATTHEQWQVYEDLKAQLHNPDYLAKANLNDFLATPGVDSLPSFLRAELAATLAESMGQGGLAGE